MIFPTDQGPRRPMVPAARVVALLIGTLAAALPACGGGRGEASSAAAPDPAAPAAAGTENTAPSATTTATPGHAEATGPLAAVSWLVGSWRGTSAEGATLEETWSAAEGTTMKGTSKLVGKDGKVTDEVLRIEARDGGAIVYVAQPGGAPPTEFTRDARTSGPTHAQFVNEQHDWPTRIRYERAGDELRVRLRGRPGQADETFVLKAR